MIIESRIGKQDVDESKIIFFPKGIIGFEGMRKFTLLQIKEDSPFLLLQSLDDAVLGLLVADPFSFLPDYSIKIGDAEQALLQANSSQELAVLVTASIPPGEPEKTTLNLLGPILINHESKIGLQIPQTDLQQHSHVKVHVTESEAE